MKVGQKYKVRSWDEAASVTETRLSRFPPAASDRDRRSLRPRQCARPPGPARYSARPPLLVPDRGKIAGRK